MTFQHFNRDKIVNDIIIVISLKKKKPIWGNHEMRVMEGFEGLINKILKSLSFLKSKTCEQG